MESHKMERPRVFYKPLIIDNLNKKLFNDLAHMYQDQINI